MSTTLILPGLYSSGPDHWQTWFEEEIPGTVRVIQGDWAKPDLAEWSRRVRRDMARTPGRLYLVAHSFGVLAGVHAALAATDRRGACRSRQVRHRRPVAAVAATVPERRGREFE